MSQDVDVAVVGGGPAGALTAMHIARRGLRVVLLERAPEWRWRAGGVFSSPATVAGLRAAGVEEQLLGSVARPIPALRVETPGGAAFRLTYGADREGAPTAVGFDRAALDPALLALAGAAGVDVRRGVTAVTFRLPCADSGGARGRPALDLRAADGSMEVMSPRLVIGADGPRSVVARGAGVVRRPRLGTRLGLTWHVADGSANEPQDARMVVLAGGAYCGIAPVPRGRVNIGVVLAGRAWRERLAKTGAAAVGRDILAAIPPLPGGIPEAWRGGAPTDDVAGASPLGHRVGRRAGEAWLLVGDAAGFLDPFTGEGLHRAVASARLAADAAVRYLAAGDRSALTGYDRAMGERFARKDVVSLIVQAFLTRPPLFEYAARRLARRPGVRETMGLVMGDLVPASRALDPRFLAALLAP